MKKIQTILVLGILSFSGAMAPEEKTSLWSKMNPFSYFSKKKTEDKKNETCSECKDSLEHHKNHHHHNGHHHHHEHHHGDHNIDKNQNTTSPAPKKKKWFFF